MTKTVPRIALIKIYNFLLTKLTSENKEWLTKHHKDYWRDEHDFEKIDVIRAMTPITPKKHYFAGLMNNALTICIEEMVNAIKKRDCITYEEGFNYQIPLTGDYLSEIYLNILCPKEIKRSNTKEELTQNILNALPVAEPRSPAPFNP